MMNGPIAKTTKAIAASLNEEIIPRLRARHGVHAPSERSEGNERRASVQQVCATSKRSTADGSFEPVEIEAFARALMAAGDGNWRDAFADQVDRVRDRPTLRDGLLAPAAARLGEWWTTDDASMVDVTVATARLQAALEALPGAPRDGAGSRMLLMPAPGDTHVFGLFMLADALREADWSVRVELRPDPVRINRIMASDRFDVIGIGIAATRFGPAAIDLLNALRSGARERSQAVFMAGGPGAEPNRTALLAAGFSAVVAPGTRIADRVNAALAASSPNGTSVPSLVRA